LKPESKFWKEWKAFTPNMKLYEGKNIKELSASGLKLEACCLGLDACRLHLEQLGA
jgi:hypothetical protein